MKKKGEEKRWKEKKRNENIGTEKGILFAGNVEHQGTILSYKGIQIAGANCWHISAN